MDMEPKQGKSGWVEEIEVAGNQLVDLVKKLMKEGNVRRVIIRNSKGRILIEIPLTAGVAVGGVAALAAPLLVALGALAAMIASFKVEVVRKSNDHQD